MNQHEGGKRTFVEELEVAGSELLDRIRELMKEGNTRRVTIRSSDGTELMTIPLTIGVVAGGLITIAAPLLAALGALAALMTRCKLEVVREVDEGEAQPQDDSETRKPQ
ncbi:MAG TPA: DUF4342 domain-containing protein [Gammaproteobacteria bacterium]|nr:DUF4342 domain-containing protein [Gammaproteobacteria bacterium]